MLYCCNHKITTGNIYTSLLCYLYRCVANGGVLPEVLYLQVDGESDNANMYMLAICELLVIRGGVREVHLSRLPVGHTHEDIDSVFSRIWTKVRDRAVITPQDYEAMLHTCIKDREAKHNVVDLYCIPDYKTFLDKHIDGKFGRCFKEQWTMLVFRFRKVPMSADFPNGVEMTFRPYAQDQVYEVVDSPLWECGKGVQPLLVDWQPRTKGMYLLRSLPDGVIPPQPFVPQSRAATESAVNCIMDIYGKYPDKREQYTTWLNSCYPLSDNVAVHVRTRPLFEPFAALLFSSVSQETVQLRQHQPASTTAIVSTSMGELLPATYAPDFVTWTGRQGDEDRESAASEPRICVETGLPAPYPHLGKVLAQKKVC